MQKDFFEKLLFEDESTTLDFKRDQYKFVRASDEDKSELLKDILGFANAWRRSKAYILIGVKEVQGGKSHIVGTTNHLDDHSLQQFVNNMTNQPVQFGYETCAIEGKQVGVIRIERQARPIYLKRDYGKLEKDKVYIRRGSSTDPSKPASIDEIAQMGKSEVSSTQKPIITIEFAATEREQRLGSKIQWKGEFCNMPEVKDIPDLSPPRRASNQLGILMPGLSSFSFDNILNEDFFRKYANYEFLKRLYKPIRLVVCNDGKTFADDVRVEIEIIKGQGLGVCDGSEFPEKPKPRVSRFEAISHSVHNIRPIVSRPGCVDIDIHEDKMKIEINCSALQPGRKVWSDEFYIGVPKSGTHLIVGKVLAKNLPDPIEFELKVDADIEESSLSVDELIALAKK